MGKAMTMRNRQTGLTAVGMVLLLSCIAFFALIVIRLLPMYIESFKVQAAIDSLKEEQEIGTKTPMQVRELLLKRMNVDDVAHVSAENVAISREGNTIKIDVNYEVRSPFFSNIELIGTYAKQGEVQL